jgi:hypothetical protein
VNLMPLAERLQAMGFGAMGDLVFINMIPVDAPTGVLLRNHLSGTPIDYELPGYYRTGFRLIARSKTYQEGESLIERAIEALTVQDKHIADMRVVYLRPSTEPVVYPLSIGNLLEFSADMDIVFTRT